jgi:16S rRNA processing protein RimM
LSSTSSNSPERRYLPIGRVTGHRGGGGEITVKVGGGDAAVWQGLSRFRIGPSGGPVVTYEAREARSYRDRLVLRLRGVDDASAAAAMRGAEVYAAVEDAPVLPDHRHYCAALLGLAVFDETGRELGEVEDVVPTGGTDLLKVRRRDAGGEREGDLLIPMAREIVLEIDERKGRVTVRLPAGLEELNR